MLFFSGILSGTAPWPDGVTRPIQPDFSPKPLRRQFSAVWIVCTLLPYSFLVYMARRIDKGPWSMAERAG